MLERGGFGGLRLDDTSGLRRVEGGVDAAMVDKLMEIAASIRCIARWTRGRPS